MGEELYTITVTDYEATVLQGCLNLQMHNGIESRKHGRALLDLYDKIAERQAIDAE